MSAEPELIELRNLVRYPDGLRGQEPGRSPGPRSPGRLERANALRIAPGRGPDVLPRGRQIRLLGGHSDPRLTAGPGRGHCFRPSGPGTHTWCDLCGDFIWGVIRKGLQCVHCKFTCHYRCRALIRLDCCGPRELSLEPALERDTNVGGFPPLFHDSSMRIRIHEDKKTPPTPPPPWPFLLLSPPPAYLSLFPTKSHIL